MSPKEIATIVSFHSKWLKSEPGGKRAHLQYADLQGADLRSANLRSAHLQGANLRNADLQGADLQTFQICPEEGDFVAWKKLRDDVVCKLLIPSDAKRTSSLIGRKCRAEFVEVLEGEGVDRRTGLLKYSPDEIVRPDSYDDDVRLECTHGIHFFITRAEAEKW